MRVLGIPIVGPRTVVRRTIRDLAAIERLIVTLPDQLERGLTIGEELVVLAYEALEKAERLDARAAEIEKFRAAAHELAAVLPAIELASGLASPLGSAIDRVGRIVGLQAAGAARRKPPRRATEPAQPAAGTVEQEVASGEEPVSAEPQPEAPAPQDEAPAAIPATSPPGAGNGAPKPDADLGEVASAEQQPPAPTD